MAPRNSSGAIRRASISDSERAERAKCRASFAATDACLSVVVSAARVALFDTEGSAERAARA